MLVNDESLDSLMLLDDEGTLLYQIKTTPEVVVDEVDVHN